MTGLPPVGAEVTWGRTIYTVVALGCPTSWAECPHGTDAVAVVKRGWTLTECAPADKLEVTS